MILIIAIVCIVGILIAVNVVFGGINQISSAADDMGNIHALVLLEDARELISAQFMILNADTKRAALVDLPPYLGVIIDSSDNLDRIDRLIAENNFSEYIDEIEAFTDRDIDFYLRFDVREFTAFIDLLEGVRLFIISTPSDVQSLPSGDVILDGYKTEEYIALYRNEQDSKIQTEGLQEIIHRTMVAVSNRGDYLGNSDVLNYTHKIAQTNLRKNELRTLLTDIMRGINEDEVQTWSTQGDVRSVVVDDRRESLLFPDLNGRWIADTVAQIEWQMVNRRAFGADNQQVRIQILNGTPTNGLARRTKLLYEQFGYTVTDIDNYTAQNVAATRIVHYGLPADIADEAAGVISLPSERVEQSTETGIDEYDITLIIGTDFDGVKIQ